MVNCSTSSRLSRFIRPLIYILSGFVGILLLIMLILTTSLGQRQLLRFTTYLVSDLKIAQIQGGLGEKSGLILTDITFSQPHLHFNLAKVEVKWDLTCLREKTLCIEKLRLFNPHIALTLEDTPSNTSTNVASSSQSLALPLSLVAKSIDIHDADFHLNNKETLRLGHFHTAFRFSSTHLRLEPTQIQDLFLSLVPQTEIAKTPKDGKPDTKIGAWQEGNSQNSAPNTTLDEHSHPKNLLAKVGKVNTKIGAWLPPEIKEEGVDWFAVERFLSQPLFSLQDIRFPFKVEIESLRGENWQFETGENADDTLDIHHIFLKANAQNSDVTLEKLQIESEVADINATGEIHTTGNFPLRLSWQSTFHPLAPHHYFYQTEWLHLFLQETCQINIEATGNLNATTTLAIQTKGSLTTDIHLDAQLTTPKMPFHLQVKSQAVQYPFYSKSSDPYRFKNADIHLSGNLLGYTGNIHTQFLGKRPTPADVNLTIKADLTYVAIEAGKIQSPKGVANLKGQISWRNQLKWQAFLNLVKFDIKQVFENIPAFEQKDLPATALSGEIHFHGDMGFYDDNWQMQFPYLALTGEWSHQPLRLNAKIFVDQHRLRIPAFSLIYGENSLKIKGQLGETNQLTAYIHAPNLIGLYPHLQANLQGEIHLDSQKQENIADIHLTGKNFRLQNIRVQHFDINAKLTQKQVLMGQAHIQLHNLFLDQTQFSHINLQAWGSEHHHQIVLTSHSPRLPLSSHIRLQGGIDPHHNWQGEMYIHSLRSPAGKWHTNHPISLHYDIANQQGRIAPHCWINQHTQLCFPTPILVGEKGELAFRLQPFDLALLNPLLPQQRLQGKLRGEGKLQWQPQHPFSANLQIKGEQIQFEQQIDYRHLRLKLPQIGLSLQWANHQLLSELHADIQNTPLSLGQLSAKLALSDLDKDRKLAGKIDLHGISLSLLHQLFLSEGNLQGELSSHLQLAGNLNAPLLYGEMGINQIKTNLQRLPFDIQKGKVWLTFQGKNAQLTGKVKTKQSEIHLSGEANWTNLQQYMAQVHLNADNLYLNLPLNSIQAELKISPDVSLKVDNESLALQGQIHIPWARIDVKQLPESGVAVSPDLIILDGKNQTKQNTILAIAKKGKTPRGLKIRSHLNILIGNDVNFKAYGLNTELQGKLALTERQGELGIYGQIHLEKGQFTAYGQNLLIKKGYIGFSGMPDKPTLSLDAIRNPNNMIDTNVVAGLRVSGYASQPKIQVYTIPATSEDQALSYLITGHAIDSNDDAGAGGSVGAALISLSLAKTTNVLNSLGNVFGISNLSLGTTGAGNQSQVSLNGNITDRLQVRYGIGLFTGLAELTLRLRILPKLYLQSISGVNQAMDIIYQFEI